MKPIVVTSTPIVAGRVTATDVRIIGPSINIHSKGAAIRNPEDDPNIEVGVYLATARALADAARKLRKAAYAISNAECAERLEREAVEKQQRVLAEKKRKADARKYKEVRKP